MVASRIAHQDDRPQRDPVAVEAEHGAAEPFTVRELVGDAVSWLQHVTTEPGSAEDGHSEVAELLDGLAVLLERLTYVAARAGDPSALRLVEVIGEELIQSACGASQSGA